MRKQLKFTQAMAVMFDPALYNALKAFSKESGMSMGKLVRRACCHWLASDDAKNIRKSGEQETMMRSFLQGWSKPEDAK